MAMQRLLLFSAVFIMLCFVFTSQAFANSTLLWPAKGEVIKQFTPDEHRGIDIAASVGDTITATREGVVHWVGKTPSGEPCISIDHPGGLTSTYLPVQVSVQKGQAVKAGDAIGMISRETDKSSDKPHLHFGIFDTASRSDKNYLNPCDFLLSKDVKTGNSSVEVEKPAQVMVLADIPKNNPGEVAAVKPSVEPIGPRPVEAAMAIRVEAAMPSSPHIENPAVPIASPSRKVTNLAEPPLKYRGKETNLSRLALVSENKLIVSLDKVRYVGTVKPPRYLWIISPYVRLLAGVGSAFLILTILMLIVGRVLLTSRVPAIIGRSYTPASA